MARVNRIEEPEERVPEDLARSNKKYNKRARLQETSVTAEKYYRNMLFIKIFIGVTVVAVIGAAIYYGVNLFIS